MQICYMQMDKELKYTDPKGEWHAISTIDVDHIEKNTGVAEPLPDAGPDMVPGSSRPKPGTSF